MSLKDTLFPPEYRHYLPTVGIVTAGTGIALGVLFYWIFTLPFP